MRIGALGLTVLALALGPSLAWAADKPTPKSQAPAAAAAPAMPRAEGSALAGLGFGDKPFRLTDDGTFSGFMKQVAKDINRTCGPLEAFGWELKVDDQKRVDGLTNSVIGSLREGKYQVKAVTAKSVPANNNVVLYTADRTERHLVILMSLSPPPVRDQMAQLVLLICDARRAKP
jgi:hypothetical protein